MFIEIIIDSPDFLDSINFTINAIITKVNYIKSHMIKFYFSISHVTKKNVNDY